MSSLAEKDIFTVLKRGAAPVFVETGTFRGDTAAWALERFDRVYSIELSPELHRKCVERFRGEERISLLQGDSVSVLAGLLPQIAGKCFFWLDAHYSSGETACGDVSVPLLEELAVIARHDRGDHVIVIDDCRLFGWTNENGTEDWRAVTRKGVEEALARINPRAVVFEYEDTIVAAPREDLRPGRHWRTLLRRGARLFGKGA